MTDKKIKIIGAGLAGCEAAWQAAKLGVQVELYEMKPIKFSPAHHSEGFAELVCSNSFRSNVTSNAVGLLKEELKLMGSLILEAAYATEVPAGSALAVNREEFSNYITNKIKSNPNITVINEEVTDIDFDGITVVASGPLTSSFILPFAVGVCYGVTGGVDSILSNAFGIVAMVAMAPLITIQVLGFRAIIAKKISDSIAMKKILGAEDEQIINFM